MLLKLSLFNSIKEAVLDPLMFYMQTLHWYLDPFSLVSMYAILDPHYLAGSVSQISLYTEPHVERVEKAVGSYLPYTT